VAVVRNREGTSGVSSWNFAEVWETVAEVQPDRIALVQGDRRTTWAAFDRRADAVAAWLLAEGLEPGTSVAQYLYS
jgi:fatty-acyl-CoA synthase